MKVVATVSGGLDSAVLLYRLVQDGHEVKAISFDYGQLHVKELGCAAKLCETVGVEHRVAQLSGLSQFLGGNALTQPDVVDVPDGHYEDESMKATVVPNRNMIMISIAAGWAIAEKFDGVAIAVHKGDHTIYPDCRERFVIDMQHALRTCHYTPVELRAPFVNWSKVDIVQHGAGLGVPFVWTWSCYRGGSFHCGTCGTCVERREAFQRAGIDDPTPYVNTARTKK